MIEYAVNIKIQFKWQASSSSQVEGRNCGCQKGRFTDSVPSSASILTSGLPCDQTLSAFVCLDFVLLETNLYIHIYSIFHHSVCFMWSEYLSSFPERQQPCKWRVDCAFFARCTNWTHSGDVMPIHLHISFPYLLSRFWLNLVLGINSKRHQANSVFWVLVIIAPALHEARTELRFLKVTSLQKICYSTLSKI